ncbi:hypothetical protein ACN20G_29865 (plasmid) [Streptomyces sp. BI20]|uniref:hypothetical protein n=1 Tax=Streptomyces sp. BI20 TaxID=3403460 RepID=UPI003C7245AF
MSVLVYPLSMQDDGYGGLAPKASGAPVAVRAFVQPMESGEVSAGDASPIRYKLFMNAVAGLRKWSRVDIDGEPFYAVYPPRWHRGSPATEFVSAIVEGAEVYGLD